MPNVKKTLSVLLAVLMALTACSVAVFAADADDNSAKVAGWKQNDSLILDTVLDNTKFTSWQYVDINNKAIRDTMNVYTAFALYDSAWKNFATKEVNIEDAEKILLALIEKAEYSFNDGYVDEIISVLETASDVNDFIQKVNKYAKIEAFASEGWSTAFDVVNAVIKVGNAYQTYRDKFIKAYAEALSVQRANAYYIDMLQYVADTTEYDVLATAANNLISKMNASVESVLADIAAEAAGDGANMAFEYLAKLALNTNVYTAAALKVYQIGTSAADILWGTRNHYVLIDTVLSTYYFQTALTNYTTEALYGSDADKAVIAMDMLLTTRAISEQSLYDMKLAENNGLINAIRNKLYNTVYNDTELMIAAVDAMRSVLFGDNNAKVVAAVYVCGPVNLTASDVAASKAVISDYSGDRLQVAYITAATAVTLIASASGKVSVEMDVLAGNTVKAWYISDLAVSNGAVVAFNTAAVQEPTFAIGSDVKKFTDTPGAENTPNVTVSDVVDVTTEVVKDKVKKSFGDMIAEFFRNLFESLFKIFKK